MKHYPSLWHLAQADLARFVPPTRQPSSDPRHDPLIAALDFGTQSPALPDAAGPNRSSDSGSSYNPLAAISNHVFSAASAGRAAPRAAGSVSPATNLDIPPIGSSQPGDSLIAPSAFDPWFGAPLETGESARDAVGLGTGALADGPTAPSAGLPDSARDVIAQLLPGMTVDPDVAAAAAVSGGAASAPHLPGASASHRPAQGPSAFDAPAGASSAASALPPPLRLEITNQLQLKQQLARDFGREVNEKVRQQIREQVTGPMARLDSQIRALYGR